MVKLTLIARVTDGLPLAEGLDDGRDVKDAEMYKQQVKALFKNLASGHNDASRMSIETGPYIFQYPAFFFSGSDHFITFGRRVCYLTMCDRSYPKKLAFQYLEDLKNEFERVNGPQIETAARPYAFIKFDTFIQKTKKLYQDTRTQRNIAKLNDELYEVHQIMTRNVQEVLGVGEKLDQVSQMSSRLTSESRVYADKARDLNRQALIRKWAPVAIVLGVVFLLFWIKTKLCCSPLKGLVLYARPNYIWKCERETPDLTIRQGSNIYWVHGATQWPPDIGMIKRNLRADGIGTKKPTFSISGSQNRVFIWGVEKKLK
ncbi:25.3 kDa vesicle transport protein [Populus alba x Populus x berolinensis]|uniref:25.3 kDa vesicle transport protein n=1 Tax=Populus alba x Populus x berolinensis TaxID=444605 RepID=A0AAD6WA76_9ROSI|nr:25.3 kDa vesicle transport protein [Populus alba x Populus x berolinensis]